MGFYVMKTPLHIFFITTSRIQISETNFKISKKKTHLSGKITIVEFIGAVNVKYLEKLLFYYTILNE